RLYLLLWPLVLAKSRSRRRQPTSTIDEAAIANSPNEVRTISKPIFSGKTEQFCSSARRWRIPANVTLLNFDVRFTPESGHS
ncbi:MAG: hypothetical protein WBO12_08670, partial [Xanthobacteraceae bacterium]